MIEVKVLTPAQVKLILNVVLQRQGLWAEQITMREDGSAVVKLIPFPLNASFDVPDPKIK